MIRTSEERKAASIRPQTIERPTRATSQSSHLRSARRHGKRAFDLGVLIVSHLALLPLLVLLWTLVPLAIWLEDRGPVFYTQRRVGKNGKVFRLFKFRSMIRDAESRTGPVLALERDPRITRVGRFLRATALDELPQLINVWKGDLSLVGPRPERPELIAVFARDLPQFLQRLDVTPGLTGLAQIYGRYSTLPRHKLLYDRIYIRKQSLLLDAKILLLSALVTLRGNWQARDKHLRHWGRHTVAARKVSRPKEQEPARR